MASLLERFGGDLAVDDFVNAFYDEMDKTKDLHAFFAKHNMRILKDRTVDYLVSDAAFGTEPYKGPDLFTAHASLNITSRHFDVMMTCIKAYMKEKSIAKALAQEVIEKIETMREPITDPGGKMKKKLVADLEEQKKKFEKEDDVDPTGFGMSTSKETMQKWKDEEEKRKQLKEKLAAARRARLKESKQQAQQQAASKAKAKAKPKPKLKSKPSAISSMFACCQTAENEEGTEAMGDAVMDFSHDEHVGATHFGATSNNSPLLDMDKADMERVLTSGKANHRLSGHLVMAELLEADAVQQNTLGS